MITWLVYEKKKDSRGALLNLTFSIRRFPNMSLEKKFIFNVFPELKERSLGTAHNSALPFYPQRCIKRFTKYFRLIKSSCLGHTHSSYVPLNVSVKHLVPVV